MIRLALCRRWPSEINNFFAADNGAGEVAINHGSERGIFRAHEFMDCDYDGDAITAEVTKVCRLHFEKHSVDLL